MRGTGGLRGGVDRRPRRPPAGDARRGRRPGVARGRRGRRDGGGGRLLPGLHGGPRAPARARPDGASARAVVAGRIARRRGPRRSPSTTTRRRRVMDFLAAGRARGPARRRRRQRHGVSTARLVQPGRRRAVRFDIVRRRTGCSSACARPGVAVSAAARPSALRTARACRSPDAISTRDSWSRRGIADRSAVLRRSPRPAPGRCASSSCGRSLAGLDCAALRALPPPRRARGGDAAARARLGDEPESHELICASRPPTARRRELGAALLAGGLACELELSPLAHVALRRWRTAVARGVSGVKLLATPLGSSARCSSSPRHARAPATRLVRRWRAADHLTSSPWSSPSTVPPGPGSRRSRAPSRSGSASPTSTRGRCTAPSRSAPPAAATPPRRRARAARARRPRAARRRGRHRARSAAVRSPRPPRACPPTRRSARRSSTQQRRILADGDWVAEGRDIGTVVAPDAEVKVFLTADPEERARRRAAELGADSGGCCASRRCATSATAAREHAPLVPAPDAVAVDTTGLTLDEVVEQIVDARGRGQGARRP